MIYLIDDNIYDQQLREYRADYLYNEMFKGHLVNINKLVNKLDPNDITHLDFLQNADCILLHESTLDVDENGIFIDGSTTNVTKIREIICDDGDNIPLVLFTNGRDGVEYNPTIEPNIIRIIRKDLFYGRLYNFIKEYVDFGIVDLRLLAFEKRELIRVLKKYSICIYNSLEAFSDNDILERDVLIKLEGLKELITYSSLSLEPETIINKIASEMITKQSLLSKIKQMYSEHKEHGKLVHYW